MSIKLNAYEVFININDGGVRLADFRKPQVFAKNEAEARAIIEQEFPNSRVIRVTNLTEGV